MPIDFGKLLRFSIVGVASNIIGYLVYLAVTYWMMGPKTAMTLLYMVGVLVGFIGNKKFAFRDQVGWWSSGVNYSLVHVVGYAMNFCMLYVFSNIMGYPHQWVQAVAIIVVAAYTFIALNIFVFKSPKAVQ